MVCLPAPTGPRVFGALEPDPEERQGRAGESSVSRSPEAPALCPGMRRAWFREAPSWLFSWPLTQGPSPQWVSSSHLV